MCSEKAYFIGVDVGTQSVRAGLVTCHGEVVEVSSLPIRTSNPFSNMYEQSSDEIWALCIQVIKTVTKNVDNSLIKGIGFDATCSLVALDRDFQSLSVSKTGDTKQNIMLWMDHRATEEASFINSKKNKVLKYVGNIISPEMEPPKLVWLKKNLPNQWAKAGHFFDLPDYLTWKATGSLQRSLCSLGCKWTYVPGSECGGWQDDFWTEIGLGDLVEEKYVKIGTDVLLPGEACGNGLSIEAANELGLIPGIPVSASIIDAHSGGLGVLACTASEEKVQTLDDRMALISGTSTCHMKISKNPIFTPGVWGPYYSAMVPNYWCSEAGQSAAGSLLDHVINTHSASIALKEEMLANKDSRHITDVLNEYAEELKKSRDLPSVSLLVSDYHVYPDYHGNRSPVANPDMKGMICGLSLSSDREDLVKVYISTVQALAYSTKHIINALEEKGHVIKTLLFCGGLSKNYLYVQLHADIIGLQVIIPETKEPVLVGSAILAASAAKYYHSVEEAMSFMCGKGKLIESCTHDKIFHEKKYKVFLTLLKCQEEVRKIMEKQYNSQDISSQKESFTA
ncbi:hypothetical protein JTE90_005481 [Oedothorax gibbosus]|uniref:FGGY carbohydrate kinase domain-containing protein n=1 Tax=Oedothorax gibbosus TaxID=931172 RepID=A0AAV6UMH3_9ARAC|nr:hypothetical protein JTE90_005481 [Oedothorax gibbosus]